jgi:DNA-binding NarL/FixJ family response regulator/signal transduction histidine kinase
MLEPAQNCTPGTLPSTPVLEYDWMVQPTGSAVGPAIVQTEVLHTLTDMQADLRLGRMAVLMHDDVTKRIYRALEIGWADSDAIGWAGNAQDFPRISEAVQRREPVLAGTDDTLPGYVECLNSRGMFILPLTLKNSVPALILAEPQEGTARITDQWQRVALLHMRAGGLAAQMQRQSAELYEERLRRSYLREIAAAILEGQPIAETGRRICELISQRLKVDRVGLFLNDRRGVTVPAALRNISIHYAESVLRLATRSPIRARAEATSLPVYIPVVQDDVTLPAELKILMKNENIESVLMAMLQHESEMMGALVVYPPAARNLTPSEISMFQGFADMAALSVTASRQVEQQRGVAALAERNRLAREIHDTVAQSLSALSLQLETAQAYLDSNDRASADEMLSEVRNQAKMALQETRRAIQGLSAAPLDSLSLAEAIEDELTRNFKDDDISTQFVITGAERAVPPEMGTALLRIAQEALNNARRHALAHRIRAGLQYTPDEIILIVEDDGVGFDTSEERTPGAEGGYGLFGMEERVLLLGGSLQIDSTPGWGTRVRASVPCRAQAAIEPAPAPTQAVVEQAAVESLRMDHLRIVIADDHTLARQGLRAMLETDPSIRVEAEAPNGRVAYDVVSKYRPDVVLLDLQMPEWDGIETLKRIRADLPEMPVIIVTSFASDAQIVEAVQAGARGFLLKDAAGPEILAAVRAAYRGETVLSSSLSLRLATMATTHSVIGADGVSGSTFGLNGRELEVLQLLAQGSRNKEIAAALFLAPKTVEFHLSNIFTKMQVTNRTEAARLAMENGLVKPRNRP